ncbi:putative intracellular septation protein A [mine drainage metagenome]|uniref:Putative intracellular septation protein A n=1 Tax=mine drainage metagenome TaxID=410659 RepID=A0A1J5RYJ2_9ZZZZ
MSAPSSRPVPSWVKPVTDFAPLALFFLVFKLHGLLPATTALIAATLAALALNYVYTRKLALVPLATAVIVTVFGGLTLWLHDDAFIKMKPTIIYGLFAAVLAGGLALKKPLLAAVMGEALPLDEMGWRRLTVRFVAFFLAMAVANEIIRRLLTTEQWVLWKVPGSLIVTFLFMLMQTGLIRRHRLPEAGEDKKTAD